MHLFWFFLLMLLLGVAFTWVEPFLVMPVMGATALAYKLGKRTLYVVGVIGWFWQLYVLLAWCLLTLLLTRLFMGQHHWLYYVVGFVECISPIMYMMSHDYMHRTPTALEDLKNFAVLVIVAAGFVLFSIVPVLATPWLFWLRWTANAGR